MKTLQETIKETLKASIKEETLAPKELKDIIADGEDPQDYWADNILYNGRNLFKDYIKFLGEYDTQVDQLKPGRFESDYTDELFQRDLQESYLGYIESLDMFITGFDMWEDDMNPAGILKWKLIDGNGHVRSEQIDYDSDMMYGSDGAYDKLHMRYKELIDIRLD